MSYNKYFAGISVPLHEGCNIVHYYGVMNDKHFEDEDHISEDAYDNDQLNTWKLKYDYDGKWGWVYVVEDRESYGNLSFNLPLSFIQDKVKELRAMVRKKYNEAHLMDNRAKVFAIEWYNGSDCDFRF